MEAWSKGPIMRHDNLTRTYSFFSYEDVKSILVDHETFGSEMPQGKQGTLRSAPCWIT